MYPVMEKDEGGNDLFYRRVQDDYSPKHNIEYVPPPVIKNLQDKSTFVHNCIANKNKTNINFVENIYNKKVFNEKKHKIMTILHENSVDFRSLANLKNALFDSEELRENHIVPLSVWKEQVKYQCQNALDPCEQLILEEI